MSWIAIRSDLWIVHVGTECGTFTVSEMNDNIWTTKLAAGLSHEFARGQEGIWGTEGDPCFGVFAQKLETNLDVEHTETYSVL